MRRYIYIYIYVRHTDRYNIYVIRTQIAIYGRGCGRKWGEKKLAHSAFMYRYPRVYNIIICPISSHPRPVSLLRVPPSCVSPAKIIRHRILLLRCILYYIILFYFRLFRIAVRRYNNIYIYIYCIVLGISSWSTGRPYRVRPVPTTVERVADNNIIYRAFVINALIYILYYIRSQKCRTISVGRRFRGRVHEISVISYRYTRRARDPHGRTVRREKTPIGDTHSHR